MKKKICVLTLCLSLLFLSAISSCSRREDEPVKAEPAGENVSVDGKQEREKHEARERTRRTDTSLSVVSEPEGRDFLLYSEKDELQVFPEDFEIGELQDLNDPDEQVGQILQVAGGFLDSIVAGEPDYGFVVGDKKDFVQKNVDFGLMQEKPVAYRIGLLNMMSSPARAAVRLEGPEGFSGGTIYFVKTGTWKVFDFHMDFSDMNNNMKKSEETHWSPSERLM